MYRSGQYTFTPEMPAILGYEAAGTIERHAKEISDEDRWRLRQETAVPIDNNQIENLIRPWALGRSNWLFAGSLRCGKRAAAIMSLIQSARINGHDPYAYLREALTRLPTQQAREIDQLLPHRWTTSLPMSEV